MPDELVPSAEQFIDYFGEMSNSLKEAKALIAQAETARVEVAQHQHTLHELRATIVQTEADRQQAVSLYQAETDKLRAQQVYVSNEMAKLSNRLDERRAEAVALETNIATRTVACAALTDQQVQDAKTRIALDTDLAQQALASLRNEIGVGQRAVYGYASSLRKILEQLDQLCALYA